ncbi:hypothetical protein QLS71_008235 [Mariniflexile litorale]|uniref:DUF7793 domain-containing protein n=1 Tax=Mariniflexile litorale TaxID=3045158 RepID=A0AAU7EK63_9FLAO|nr:hypothetical protein [Mariniflexile sp. KMM 9835]MDQ8212779.1 hypothetical protein [Mariniflexile sp. KMM 9835]
MVKQIKCKKAKFWLKEGVLFCRFIRGECKKEFSQEFLDEHIKAITTLSNGRYYPLLIDLRQLNENYAFSVVKIIANNPELKSVILSKSFVVNSCFVQFVLVVLKRIDDPVIPNKVFRNYDTAIEYSLETNHFFNAIN